MGGECVVVEAFQIKPVSTANSLLNREINREFCRFGPPGVILASYSFI